MAQSLSAPAVRRSPRTCFVVPGRLADRDLAPLPPTTLSPRCGEALAVLVSLMACGEEAASIAFDGLAAQDAGAGAAALRTIAQEERVHDAWLRQLTAALPPAPHRAAMLARARRFHIDLAAGGPALHFARIAALDAAVCLILSRLLHRGGAIAGDPGVASLLIRIRRDEARHVAIARAMALGYADRPAMHLAADAARGALAAIFALASDALATLGVDADRLLGDVRRLPPGLIPA